MKSRYTFYLLLLILVITSQSFAQVKDWFQLHGYMSLEFEKTLKNDAVRGDKVGSFDMDAIDLIFNIQATNRLRVAADLTWEHGAVTELSQGNVAIEFAFGEYTISDWLKIRVGKMFTAFGIYNEIHTAKPTFLSVKEPNSTNRTDRVGNAIRFYPRWNAGISVLGNFDFMEMPFDYVVQIANGDYSHPDPAVTDDNPFDKDINSQKAINGRIRFNPISPIQVGISFYSDLFTEFTPKVSGSTTTYSDNGLRTSFFSYGGFLTYNKDNLGIELEYMSAKVGNTVKVPEYSLSGYSAMLFYTLAERYTPYIRYEGFEPNNTIADDKATVLVYGLNVMIDDGLFLKVDMNSFSGETKNSRLKGLSYDELKISTSIGF